MAQRRRGSRSGRRSSGSRRSALIAPQTARSILGIVLLVAGAVTLIALLLPGEGILNRYVNDILRPAFGQGAWLLPVLLIVAGVFVERAPSTGPSWEMSAAGGILVFLGALGLMAIAWGDGDRPRQLAEAGGWFGETLSSFLTTLVSEPGAVVVLLGMMVVGVLLLFNLTVRDVVSPVTSGGRAVAGALTRPIEARDTAPPRSTTTTAAKGRNGGQPAPEAMAAAVEPDLPVPIASPAPISQTVWSGRGAAGGAGLTGAAVAGAAVAVAAHDPDAPGDDLLAVEDTPQPVGRRDWVLPDIGLLEPARREPASGQKLDHERNIRIIEEKLRSFQIPATVTGTNVGPVVTQYEVRPDARIKLSRIEGLADDLAMALAARTIRIEAPIPGKDVVGIEIPNHASEVVGFRELIDDANMLAATGKLTFALGRDVSGAAYAVDLAKMPHLLIAGATGSGKSVCVNALITSLLMRARPDEVRLVLVDLKRVELAAYDDLPHLLTNVIVEAGDAKAALHWAVGQMEERYKALAAKTERNIGAYNASPRVSEGERLPYIVIVIDELADLIMREGRKVEDPIVKIAQKARAVGIHLVLATQRPSVNVVTGLIKANVPSRIAFAMASNIDSRTVLDQPGAEDLIGRGDMLFQPADLPRPVRLQGVFVSDAEVNAVTAHWREQSPEPEYDPLVVAFSDGDGANGGQFGWLAQIAEDDMTPRAAELVLASGKASTSMLQTKLKVGFNRASRIMDELERVGIVGPQDPRNPAVPRQIYGPENWIRSVDDMDDPGY
ncbi:MAG TPA: DNA translocase FtsK 4TM domain-containing protein [Candidatus Limnocylindrales bacterium]|jgi:S-DNA-T family DNA segregation ATPase FtsK/SpoIIIE